MVDFEMDDNDLGNILHSEMRRIRPRTDPAKHSISKTFYTFQYGYQSNFSI
jgi:hypothetical protein